MVNKVGKAEQIQNRQQIFALCGIIAPILFLLLVIVASLLRSDYSQTHNFVSDLGVGPYALIQNINFIIFGSVVHWFSPRTSKWFTRPPGQGSESGRVVCNNIRFRGIVCRSIS